MNVFNFITEKDIEKMISVKKSEHVGSLVHLEKGGYALLNHVGGSKFRSTPEFARSIDFHDPYHEMNFEEFTLYDVNTAPNYIKVTFLVDVHTGEEVLQIRSIPSKITIYKHSDPKEIK